MGNSSLDKSRDEARRQQRKVDQLTKELDNAKRWLDKAENEIAVIEEENHQRLALLPQLIGARLDTLNLAHEGYSPSQIRQWKATLDHITSKQSIVSEAYSINEENSNLHAGSMARLVKEGYFYEFVSSGFRQARDSHYYLITVKGVEFLISHLQVELPLTFKPN